MSISSLYHDHDIMIMISWWAHHHEIMFMITWWSYHLDIVIMISWWSSHHDVMIMIPWWSYHPHDIMVMISWWWHDHHDSMTMISWRRILHCSGPRPWNLMKKKPKRTAETCQNVLSCSHRRRSLKTISFWRFYNWKIWKNFHHQKIFEDLTLGGFSGA